MTGHEWLAGFSAVFWPTVAGHLWQATLVAGLCLLALAAFRDAPAESRHLLWTIAFVRFLLPQPLVFLLAGGLSLPAVPDGSSGSGLQAVTLKMAEVAQPSALALQRPAGLDAAGHAELFCIFTIVWIAGCAFLLGRWRFCQHRLAVSLRGAREAGSDVRGAIELLKGRLGFGRKTRLRVVWQGSEPGVYGVWRPVLVLPEEMPRHLSPAEIDAVMTHELVHVARWDNLWSNLQMIVCCIFWFYPVVWLIDRRLIAERERSCDERVVGVLGNSQAYLSGLVKMASHALGFRLAGLSPIAGADLKRRIKNMMNAKKKIGLSARVLLTFIAALVVLLYLVAAPQHEIVGQTTPSGIKIENTERSPLQIVSAYVEDIVLAPPGARESKPRLVKPRIVVKNNSDKAIAVYELEFKTPGSHSVFLVRNQGSFAAKATELIDAGTIEKPTTSVFAHSPAEKGGGGVGGTWTVHVIVVRFEDGKVVTLHPMPIPPPPTSVSAGVVGGMRGGATAPVPPPPRPRQINAGEKLPASKLIKRVEPVYPEAALKARVQGRVILVINVDEQGNVTDAKVRHGHPILDDAAVVAVQQWKYSPTLLNGKPVPVIATVTVDFNLQ